jgi:hypothetical protein
VGHEVDALRQLGKYDDIRAVLKKCASQRLRHSDVPTISRMSCVRLNYSLRCQKIDHRTQTVRIGWELSSNAWPVLSFSNDCSPYRGLHVHRKSVGVVPRSFSGCVSDAAGCRSLTT